MDGMKMSLFLLVFIWKARPGVIAMQGDYVISNGFILLQAE